ncbi:hypothetical protein BCR34DRAFT_575347, partial [Clohesyomyces aquaticus]
MAILRATPLFSAHPVPNRPHRSRLPSQPHDAQHPSPQSLPCSCFGRGTESLPDCRVQQSAVCHTGREMLCRTVWAPPRTWVSPAPTTCATNPLRGLWWDFSERKCGPERSKKPLATTTIWRLPLEEAFPPGRDSLQNRRQKARNRRLLPRICAATTKDSWL